MHQICSDNYKLKTVNVFDIEQNKFVNVSTDAYYEHKNSRFFAVNSRKATEFRLMNIAS